jgi:hypothetical protein
LFSVGLLGFVDFVVNLLSRPTDGATIQGQKSASEKVRAKKSLLFVRMGVRKITFFTVPKKVSFVLQYEQSEHK